MPSLIFLLVAIALLLSFSCATDTNIVPPDAVAQNWWSIASSADGLKLCACTRVYIYTSVDGGRNWKTAYYSENESFQSVVSSADGSRLVVKSYPGIFTSSDGGNTWVLSSLSWLQTLASAADGSRMVSLNPDDGLLYTSYDGGNNWNHIAVPSGTLGWNYVSSSNGTDGYKLLAAIYRHGLYTSLDGGQNWNITSPSSAFIPSSALHPSNLNQIVTSADGSRLAAIAVGDSMGGIFTSSDGGSTWQERTNAGISFFTSISSSADGEKLVAVANGGGILISTDGGESWYSKLAATNKVFQAVASNPDMTKIVGVVPNGYVFTSSDFSKTWQYHMNAGIRVSVYPHPLAGYRYS